MRARTFRGRGDALGNDDLEAMRTCDFLGHGGRDCGSRSASATARDVFPGGGVSATARAARSCPRFGCCALLGGLALLAGGGRSGANLSAMRRAAGPRAVRAMGRVP